MRGHNSNLTALRVPHRQSLHTGSSVIVPETLGRRFISIRLLTNMNTASAHAQVQHTHRPSWAFQSLVRPGKHQKNDRCLRPRNVTVQAEKSGLQRLLQPFEGFSKEEEVSFRWDPANLRWAKSKTKMADDASMMITPLIGEPYLVSLAI